MTLLDKIKSLLQLISVDPKLALRILIKRNTKSNWLSKKVVKEPFNGVIFNFDFSLSPMVKYMYTGSYEIETYLALKKFLKPGDTFIDIGGNIGYITALGAGIVGTSGEVHSFEPIKKYFNLLQNIANDNPSYNITPNNLAISTEEGESTITLNSSENIGNNSMVSNSMKEDHKGIEEAIKTTNITDYIAKNKLTPSLIKIDTEGYELTVLESLKPYILNSKKKPVIYCEVTPEDYIHSGKNIKDLADFLDSVSYSAFTMNDLQKNINILEVKNRIDLVFKQNQ
tara:strand:- start:1673 stop:2524 length:852 start_codon:yes stop_codon:yes gene_type:complete